LFSFTAIAQYQQQLINNTTTCVQAVEFYLQQIKAKQHLNAFLEVFETEALQKAAQLDAARSNGQPMGALHGVVVGIKDVLCYKGHTVSAASKILENYTAVYNATAIEKLLAADAIIIGRQNCDEFAMGGSNENSAFGVVKNALNENKVSGGSSGGSAVAVQANMCMISLGSDTGGSVRQPADFCGIVGLKPSYGRISRYGLIAYASSFDQIGIFSQTVADAALVLETISGADNFDSTVSNQPVAAYSKNLNLTQKPTIAYFKSIVEHAGLDAEIAQQFKHYLQQLQAQGYTVQPIEFDLLPYIVPTYYILTTAEASSNLSRYDGVKFGYRATLQAGDELIDLYKKTRSQAFGKEVQRRILLGTFVLSAGYYDAYFTKAQQVRQLLVNTTNQIFEKYDCILSPTVPNTAFDIGAKRNNPVEMFLEDIFTVYANLTGIPAIAIPKFTHSNGMPFGVQVMTKAFTEEKLLQIAQALA
jgi:aspartyl-tRNA(Asn)/glutamyl-tRNA(Gln) amidotransferase subunit A